MFYVTDYKAYVIALSFLDAFNADTAMDFSLETFQIFVSPIRLKKH